MWWRELTMVRADMAAQVGGEDNVLAALTRSRQNGEASEQHGITEKPKQGIGGRKP
jgi:hypothetical protein